jgi:putative PEP-CTERM system histidine kinase
VTFASQLPFFSAACSGTLAIGVLLRARRSAARWPFAVGMFVLAAEEVFGGLAANAGTPEDTISWQLWRLLALALLPGVWLVFSLGYARGDARESLARWRLPIAGAFMLPLSLAIAFRQDLVISLYRSTEGDDWMLRLNWPGLGLHLFLLVGSVLVLMNLERTFRASVGTIRWRIKFMLLGVGVLFIVRAYTSSQALLFRGIDHSLDQVNSGALLVAILLILRTSFRAGYFDMDVYPSQSVLQSSLTGLLAGVYLLIVGVSAKVVAYLGGDAAFALKAFLILVSLVLLAILLQSDHVRWHLGRFVSRNFQRPLYDYRTVWRKFTEGTASHVEQTGLCRALIKLMADMFQALSITIWLVDDKKETLTAVASTFRSETNNPFPGPHGEEATEVIRYFQDHPEPLDFESEKGSWAGKLKQWHPTQFPNGGNRVCLPIIGRGEVLGLVTLGDRVGGAAFSLQDFDMLKCVGDHAAASLLNVQLAQKLLQAKELEAFQTMAAFFVHDLKNAASTLNLMLRNLPVHFDDPAFREDVLRGISLTANRINHLVGRLGLLRHELKIDPVEADLNEVVAKSVAGLEKGLAFAIVKDLKPLHRLPIDSEQLSKVVTNLVLNATEAVSGNGQVRIATDEANGCAVITVADNGCGMTAEFIRRSLFRPFQTTKKSGLGIGMFQSKMIVEAHGGRITATSEPGKGTVFQVLLPVESKAPLVSGKGAGGS